PSGIEYNRWNKHGSQRCSECRGPRAEHPMVFGRRSKQCGAAPPGAGGSGEDPPFADEALSYIDALYGTALRLTRRPQDAEDLVQETYLKAFCASRQFRRGANTR